MIKIDKEPFLVVSSTAGVFEQDKKVYPFALIEYKNVEADSFSYKIEWTNYNSPNFIPSNREDVENMIVSEYINKSI